MDLSHKNQPPAGKRVHPRHDKKELARRSQDNGNDNGGGNGWLVSLLGADHDFSTYVR